MKFLGLEISRINKTKNNQPVLTESLPKDVGDKLGIPKDFNRGDINQFPVDDFTFDFLDTDSFNGLWSVSSQRSELYRTFDEMSRDSIISAALELYADDAAQYDADRGVVWVESNDPELAEKLNNRLRVLGIDSKVWTIYYMLAKFGEVYLRQFKYRTKVADETSQLLDNVKEVIQFEDYIEIVNDPENYYDLTSKGKTEQFAKIVDETASKDSSRIDRRVELYPPDQLIHIVMDKPDARGARVQTLTMTDDDGETKEYEYRVREGKSMLQDIYGVQRQINLLENSIILNRLSKSAITRVVSVEVGDMPSPQVNSTLRRVKSALENKVAFDADAGMTNYNSASGMDNIVVTPTREGKGAITTEVIGGDIDVKSLVDLDYFSNKRFGALKIPKAFLGYEESLGNNGGGTLTRQDIRYGRTIKRLQTSVVNGLTTMLTIYLKSQGYCDDDLVNFKVKVVSPPTDDDEEQDTKSEAQFDKASSIMELVGDSASSEEKKLMLGYLFTNVLDHPELSKILGYIPDDDQIDDEGTDDADDELKPDESDKEDANDSSTGFLKGDPDIEPEEDDNKENNSDDSDSNDTDNSSDSDKDAEVLDKKDTLAKVTVPSQEPIIK